MELVNLIYALLLPLSMVLVVFVFSRKHKNNHPPGKRGWPVIGETAELFSWGRKGSLHKFFSERTHRYASQIFKTSVFGERLNVVCGAGGNKFLFATESRNVGMWGPTALRKIFPTMFAEMKTYNEESLLVRRNLTAGFLRAESLKKYVGDMDVVAMQLVHNIQQQRNHVTFYPIVERYTFEVACKVLLSIEDPKHVDKIYKHFGVLHTGMFSLPINLLGFPLNRAIKASRIIGNEILEIMKQRKVELSSPTSNAKKDVLFDMLTKADENGRFMEEIEIIETITGLLVAGYDPTSLACVSVINYLAELPHIYQNVYEEQMEIARSKKEGELLTWDDLQKMSYSWNVAREAIRLTPPSPIGFRQALSDLTFDGFSISKGTKILWSATTTHKDPKYFPEPEKFDPTRFQGNKIVPYSYVPFGGGPRTCPATSYARLVILVLMHKMVTTFKWEKVFRDEKIIVDPVPRPEKGLPIRLFPH